MRELYWLAALSWVALPGPVLGQGNEATSAAAQAQGGQRGEAVQIGAGSTGEVTTGASGADDPASPAIAPLAAPFAIMPPRDAAAGPAMLPIGPPQALRCDAIAEPRARQRCETTNPSTR